ncbi:site-specific integrase [Roseomonas marmotae]|uniref:Uncharacterized protein n=1 Tax=Roseomonas marmotae TaxID=2768161 RepID=A0ABS3K8I4_9PROT|nr:hypothetical protein [Roseomonas marmotae]MBO1073777.1 hypothetical protein [Roseomonas marmotae]QTI78592.1 hypothetical protein IAI58_13050 [Roseomonas marmotae]
MARGSQADYRRSLLTGYLLTAQRGGDVTSFAPDQYDEERQMLRLKQAKTSEDLLLHVTPSLARALAAMKRKN